MKVFIEDINFRLTDVSTAEGKDFLESPFIDVRYIAIINNQNLYGHTTIPYNGTLNLDDFKAQITKQLS